MNRWIVVACFLSILSSCSKDDENASPNNTNGGAEINFSSDVRPSTIVKVDASTTRAPLTTFETNSTIGIFGIPAVGDGRYDGCNLFDRKREQDFQLNLFNARYTYVDGYDKLKGDHQATFPNGSNPALVLYGYYPYSSKVKYVEINSDGVQTGGKAQWAMPWELNVDDMSQTIDYLYTGQTPAVYNNIGQNPVLLTFLHAMGRLDVRFYSTSKEICSAGYVIKKVKVTCNTTKSGWIAITDGSFTKTSENLVCNYPVSSNAGISYATPGDAAAKFMFPPTQTLIQTITCDILDNGANLLQDIPLYDYATSGYDFTIVAGKIAELSINFQPKGTSLSKPVIESWSKGIAYDVKVKLQ